MAQELKCNQKRDDAQVVKSDGQHELKPAARKFARARATVAAQGAAFDFAEQFTCIDEGCPNKKITIKIGKPTLGKCVLGPVGGGGVAPKKWTCQASCSWSAVVRCRKAPLPAEDEAMADQELGCGDDEEAYAAATCDGFGHDPDEARSKKSAETEASTKALTAVKNAIGLVRCDPDCPSKVVTVLFGPAVTECKNPGHAAAAAIGAPIVPKSNYDCSTTLRWAVWVTCE